MMIPDSHVENTSLKSHRTAKIHGSRPIKAIKVLGILKRIAEMITTWFFIDKKTSTKRKAQNAEAYALACVQIKRANLIRWGIAHVLDYVEKGTSRCASITKASQSVDRTKVAFETPPKGPEMGWRSDWNCSGR
nr:hypothetical protein HmN_000705400 [Hymenolepis microstoma]